MSRSSPTVLVVDDDPAIREVLEIRLQQWGYSVQLADSGRRGEELAERLDPAVVLSDVVMPEVSGLELLRSLKAGNPARSVILMTAYGTIDVAVDAMKEGAEDFLTKPLDYSKLRSTLDAVLKSSGQRSQARRLAERLEQGAGLGSLVGTSRPMGRIYRLIRTLGGSDASAIITGESGTGKELAARTIHELSHRSGGPFVAVNSAAIPEGLLESEVFGHEKGAFTGAVNARPGCFELAHQGTLFLDEIGEMPLALQPKLLRILEDGKVRRIGGRKEVRFDVRVLAATNREPAAAVEEGRLRKDLFYRLNVFTLTLPPLRRRLDDLPLLAQHFVQRFNDKHGTDVQGLSEEALEALGGYPWPGNVRELRNVVERGVILCRKGWLEAAHLPPYVRRPNGQARTPIVLPSGVTAEDAERILILKTLEHVGNNKAEAARRLGLDVKTIRNKLRAYEDRADS
ncbi:MAG: sigma-54 dependent transcriptional regulator [Acidobacteriota bacterium]|nr:sigma-54 dependent transcriptional regulator [Acidobacteriota bacterium]